MKFFSIKYKSLSRLFLVVIIVSNVFWLAIAFSNKTFPYQEIKKYVSKTKRFFDVKKNGEDAFVNQKIKEQAANNEDVNFESKTIETSVLPVFLKYFSLAKDNRFPAVGGAIASAEDEILIMDRLGQFYLFNNQETSKLSIVVPNNLEKYLLEYDGDAVLYGDALRAHYIVYDSVKSQIIASYTRFEGGSKTRLVVSSINVNKEDFSPKGTWSTIFESQVVKDMAHASQSGSGKIMLQDDNLFLAVGYGKEEEVDDKLYASSLDLKSDFGKILKIDLNTNESKIFSIGHRNIQGMYPFNKKDFIATEHGPQGGDEVNLIQEGKNYGWPHHTYGTRYGTYDYKLKGVASKLDDFEEPFFSFVPSIGISSIVQLDKFNERWSGDMLVGSLKSQSLYRLKHVDGRVVFQEPIWIGHRIRDIIERDNEIILLTDDANLISITVDEVNLNKNIKGNNLIAVNRNMSTCIKCHQFTVSTPNSLAPSLLGIFNKKIGSDSYERYSESLKKHQGVWDEKNLKAFLKNPNGFIPGTTMPSMNLKESEIDEIIDLLKTNN